MLVRGVTLNRDSTVGGDGVYLDFSSRGWWRSYVDAVSKMSNRLGREW